MKTPLPVLHVIPNTHWDREWYMGFERFRMRLVSMMDRLVRLLERRPEMPPFTLDGQVIPIEDYLEIRPEMADRVRALVKARRLQIGPWYTLPHETMCGGEPLLRNLQRGLVTAERLGGATKVSYLIDEFGHVTQLPQILRGCGIVDVVAWRGIPAGMPDLFQWRAPDGSVVDFFYSNAGYGHATALPLALEDSQEDINGVVRSRPGLRTRIARLIELRQRVAGTSHLLALNGIDHSFAQEDLPEALAAANALGVAQLIGTDLPGYTAAVKAAYQAGGQPRRVHAGELLDDHESILIDVHAYRPELKAANDRIERTLVHWSEPFAAIAAVLGQPHPDAYLDRAWRLVLENHSHDSIAGASHDTVYNQVMCRYQAAQDIADEIAERSLQAIAGAAVGDGGDLQLAVFNPLPVATDGTIEAEIDIPVALGLRRPAVYLADQPLPCVIEDRRATSVVRFNPRDGHPLVTPVERLRLRFVCPLPALGYVICSLREAAPVVDSTHGLVRGPGHAEDDLLALTINDDGTCDVVHKASGRRYAGLNLFEDVGDAGHGFAFAAPSRQEMLHSSSARARIVCECNSQLAAVFRVEMDWVLPARLDGNGRSAETVVCHIVSRITLARDSGRIDFETTVDNRATEHRLRVLFPTGLTDTASSWAEQPFDMVRRPMTPSISRPQLGVVAVNDGTNGLAIANRGVYQYQVLDDDRHSIALHLMRAVSRSYYSDEDSRMPLGQCLGKTTFSYSVIPHSGGWCEALAKARAFRLPARTLVVRRDEEALLPGYVPDIKQRLPATCSLLAVDHPEVQMTSLRYDATRGVLLVRLLNLGETEARVRVAIDVPGFRLRRARACDLLDAATGGNIEADQDGGLLTTIPAKGLQTWELVLMDWRGEE